MHVQNTDLKHHSPRHTADRRPAPTPRQATPPLAVGVPAPPGVPPEGPAQVHGSLQRGLRVRQGPVLTRRCVCGSDSHLYGPNTVPSLSLRHLRSSPYPIGCIWKKKNGVTERTQAVSLPAASRGLQSLAGHRAPQWVRHQCSESLLCSTHYWPEKHVPSWPGAAPSTQTGCSRGQPRTHVALTARPGFQKQCCREARGAGELPRRLDTASPLQQSQTASNEHSRARAFAQR